MRHIGRWITAGVVVAGLATLTMLRWDAWFVEPQAPAWQGDTLCMRFYCFGDSIVPGFQQDEHGFWQDTIGRDTLTILLMGDIHNQLTRADYDSMVSHHPSIDCYAQLGDWVERGQVYYEQQLYQELDSSLLNRKPVMNCPGNHEYNKGIQRTLPVRWTNTFHHPHNGPLGQEGTTYYVDFEHIRFVVLNTAGTYWPHDYLRLNGWAHDAIRNAEGRFVVVEMHHPLYSSCVGRWYGLNWLNLYWPLHKADLVFSGHDHQYTRLGNYIATTTVCGKRLHTIPSDADRVGAGTRMYHLLSISQDTLRMQTYLLPSNTLYDQVDIVRLADGTKQLVPCSLQQKEILLLDDKYTHDHSKKVQRFLRSKRQRQQTQAHE